MHREVSSPPSSLPLLTLLLPKLSHSRLVVETRSDGDEQRALWGSVNVLGQPRAAASRAPVSQCTRGKRTRTGDQHVFFASGSRALLISRLIESASRVAVSSLEQWERRGLNLQKKCHSKSGCLLELIEVLYTYLYTNVVAKKCRVLIVMRISSITQIFI